MARLADHCDWLGRRQCLSRQNRLGSEPPEKHHEQEWNGGTVLQTQVSLIARHLTLCVLIISLSV